MQQVLSSWVSIYSVISNAIISVWQESFVKNAQICICIQIPKRNNFHLKKQTKKNQKKTQHQKRANLSTNTCNITETQPLPGLGEKAIAHGSADKSERFDSCFEKPWEACQDSHNNYVEQTKILVSIPRIKSYCGGIPSGVSCLGRRKSWVSIPGHISSWISIFRKKKQL